MKRRVADNGVVADLFYDGLGQPEKAIILLGGSEGGKRWSTWPLNIVTRRLVERGYRVLSLAYFNTRGLPESLEEIPLEYFERAFQWLARQPEVLNDQYALIGGSKGGELALLLGAKYSQIKAVVGILPSSVVWQGIPKSSFAIGKNPKSSWSFGGAGLPYVHSSLSSKDIPAVITMRMRKIMERDLEQVKQIEEVEIPVERTKGPILLVSGKRDGIWPSTYMCNKILSRLEKHGFENYCEHIVFDKGHSSVLWDKTCWRAVFKFLEENYK